MSKKRLKGTIVSDKMLKTLVVRVERIKEHSKYRRRFKVHKNHKVHCEEDGFKIGDKVLIEEISPVSKGKCWKIVKKINVNL